MFEAVPLLEEKLRVKDLLLQLKRLFKIFRQDFDFNEFKYKH